MCTRNDVVNAMEWCLTEAKGIWGRLGIEAGPEQIHATGTSMFIETARRGLIGARYEVEPPTEPVYVKTAETAKPEPVAEVQATDAAEPKDAPKQEEPSKASGTVLNKGTTREVSDRKRKQAQDAKIVIDGPVPMPDGGDDMSFIKAFKTVLNKEHGYGFDSANLCTLWCALRTRLDPASCVEVAKTHDELGDLIELAYKSPIEAANLEGDNEYDPFEDQDVVLAKIRAMLAGTWMPGGKDAAA